MRTSTSLEMFTKASTSGFAGAALALRLGLGLLFTMAGWSKLMAEGGWSAAGYLQGATGPLAQWFQSMAGNVFIDQLNMWGLLLIGLCLLLGIFMRPAAVMGVVLMMLYYLSGFESNIAHGFIDEHIIYSLVLLLFLTGGFGHVWGLDGILQRRFEKHGSWTMWFFG